MESLGRNTEEIALNELKQTLKKFKRRKALGPDETPMEFYKELTGSNLREVFDLLNEWWATETIPEEQLRAKVVLILKKVIRAS